MYRIRQAVDTCDLIRYVYRGIYYRDLPISSNTILLYSLALSPCTGVIVIRDHDLVKWYIEISEYFKICGTSGRKVTVICVRDTVIPPHPLPVRIAIVEWKLVRIVHTICSSHSSILKLICVS